MIILKKFSDIGLELIVLVFNNDTFKDCYGVVPYIKEPEVCYEGYPHVSVYLAPRTKSLSETLKSFDGKEFEIVLLDSNRRELFRARDKFKYHVDPLLPEVVLASIKLPRKFFEARYAIVSTESYSEEVELPPQVKVFGRVTDFYGNPRKAYVLLVTPYGFPGGMAITRTRDDGYYEMYVPKAVYHHAFICDGNYGRSTLEFYGWNIPVEPPEFRLDARFDKIEVYRLTASETPERTLLIEFVLWDIAHTNSILKRIYEEKGKVTVEDICKEDILTPIKKEDVKVYLDDVELEIRTLSIREYSVKDYGVDTTTKAYVLECKIPPTIPRGRYKLRVVVHTVINGVEEWGEAILYNVDIWY